MTFGGRAPQGAKRRALTEFGCLKPRYVLNPMVASTGSRISASRVQSESVVDNTVAPRC